MEVEECVGLWGVVITFLSAWEPPEDRQKQTGRDWEEYEGWK